MLTDTEIKINGYKALVNALGEVDAEKFIALTMREPFDYTKWQAGLFKDVPVDELSKKAMRKRKKQACLNCCSVNGSALQFVGVEISFQ